MNVRIAALAAAALLLPAAAPAWTADDGPALAHAAAAAYAASVRGTATFEVDSRTIIRGGPIHREDVETTRYVERDGHAVRKVVTQLVESGKTSDAEDLARRSAEPDGPLSRFGLRLPYTVPADYTYEAPRPAESHLALAFHATVRDEAHGDGTMVLDPAARRIVSVTFVPAKLPAHATSAQITVDFAAVAADRWDVVRITRAFAGRSGIFRGTATAVSTYVHYRLFATTEGAEAALLP